MPDDPARQLGTVVTMGTAVTAALLQVLQVVPAADNVPRGGE